MFMREASTMTVEDVHGKLDKTLGKSKLVKTSDIKLKLAGEDVTAHTVKFGTVELPAGPSTVESIGARFALPAATLNKLPDDIVEYMLNELLKRTVAEVAVDYGSHGINALREPEAKVIDPRRYADIAAKVISPKAQVLDFFCDPNEFRLDVVANQRGKSGVGHHPKAVGDITVGGIRLGQNRKRNLAPWGARLLYRLACTNGMEMVDEAMRVDARALSIDEQVGVLLEAAQAAYDSIETDIAAFYALVNEKVPHPERTLARITSEAGLPDRTRQTLTDILPAEVALDPKGGTNMFEIVNLITNRGSEPGLRDGPMRNFQQVGGLVITDHASRCGRCQSRLSH